MTGLYIHIPFCTKKCDYCDFVSFSMQKNGQKQYVAALLGEISQSERVEIDTIFIGGGTPSAVYSGAISAIMTAVKNHFDCHIKEFTVEANPETCTEEFIKEIKAVGANRLSLGLQSASNALLKGLRRHTYEDFLQAASLAKKHGIQNINADLMLGLPNQTMADVVDSVKKIMDLGLQHISVYGLKCEEGTPLFASGFMPDDDKIADFYDAAYSLLCAQNGQYVRYEVSNFCLKGFECRHNLKYWTMGDYLGLGLNASSYLNGYRLKNTADMKTYLNRDFLESKDDCRADFANDYIMLGLRTSRGIDLNTVKKHRPNFMENPKLKYYLNIGALILKDSRLTIANDFYYRMNAILVDLLL